MAVQLLTVSEYARHRGCDEKAVRKALAEGRISRLGTDRHCIDPEVADIQWAKNTRARADSRGKAAGVPTPPVGGGEAPDGANPAPGDTYSDHRTRRERAEALMAEAELAKITGSMLEREPALRAIYSRFRELRDAGMLIGRRLAPILTPMTDQREIRMSIERAVADVFDTFSRRTLQSLVKDLGADAGTIPADVRQPATPPDDDQAEGEGAR